MASPTQSSVDYSLLPDEFQVVLWHQTFGLPVRPYGTHLSEIPREEILLAASLIFEEIQELLASLEIEIKADSDSAPRLQYHPKAAALDLFGFAPPTPSKVEVLDGICDSIFTLHALAVRLGLPTQLGHAEVTASNFSKLGPDGKPILNGITEGYRIGEAGYRADAPKGKILKGPGYYPPRLAQLIAACANKEAENLDERPVG